MVRLTVIAGGEPGRAWQVESGGVRYIGSAGASDVVLVGDGDVAAVHAGLYWVGAECRLRDMGTGGALWLNGRGASDEALRTGDVIQCGRTLLRVDGSLAEVMSGGGVGSEREPKEEALATLRGLPGKLYAVLDAARDPEILTLLRRSGYRYESLWKGWAGEVYGDVAPYLVRLRKDGRLLEQLVERGWGEGWGVYLLSYSPFRDVSRHLREIMRVNGPSRAAYYFRFYDPQAFFEMVPKMGEEVMALVRGNLREIVFERRGPDGRTAHVGVASAMEGWR